MAILSSRVCRPELGGLGRLLDLAIRSAPGLREHGSGRSRAQLAARQPELGERTGEQHNVAGVTSNSFVSMAGAEYVKTKLGCELWWTPGERDIVIDIHFKLLVKLPFGYWQPQAPEHTNFVSSHPTYHHKGNFVIYVVSVC